MLRTFLLAALLSAASAGAASVTLTPDQLRSHAAAAVQTGAPQAALAMADALLARDPADIEAHLIRSRALRDLGRPEDALAAGRAAWRLAQSKPRRFAAALAIAQAHSTAGRKTLAMLWLRRAGQTAPDAAAREMAQRDFRYLRQTAPLHLNLQANIRPSSNINNGSANSSTALFGLPNVTLSGAARALSGTEYSFGISGRYRLAQTSNRATDLTFAASTREYTLTSEAQRLAPSAKGRDFALSTLTLGLTRRLMALETRAETRASFRLGQTWYARAPYVRFARLSLERSLPLDPRQRLRFGVTGERSVKIAAAAPSSTSLSGHISYDRALLSGARLGLSLGLLTSRSQSESARYDQAHARLSYALAQPVLGASASFGLGLRYRHYDSSPYLPAGARIDKEATLDMTLAFDTLDYYGFSPTLTLSAGRTQSNIGLFDTESLGLSVGFRSNF